MIVGEGFLADGARKAFGDVPWCWILDHPTLCDHDGLLRYNMKYKVVVISTPSLVGSLAQLEETYPDKYFAYLPENVREDHPEDWKHQKRHIVGTRSDYAWRRISKHFHPTPCKLMSPESAEMVKHALNGFLAVSIAYAKEIARISEERNADPMEVAHGMMTDPRIGQRAYLRPEGDVSPHLQREVDNLVRLGFRFPV